MKISTRGANVRPQKACPLSMPRLPCGLAGARLSVRMAAFGKPEADAAKDAGIPSNIAMPKTAITESMLDAAAEAEASPKPLPMSGYSSSSETKSTSSSSSSSSKSSSSTSATPATNNPTRPAKSDPPASGNPNVRYYDYTSPAFVDPFSPVNSTPASPLPPKSTTVSSTTTTTVRSSGASGLDGGSGGSGGGNAPTFGSGKVSVGGGSLTTSGGPSGTSGGGIGSNIPPLTTGGRSSSLTIGKMGGAGGGLGVGGSDRGIDGLGGGSGSGFKVGGTDLAASQLAYGGSGGSGSGGSRSGGGGGGGGKGDSSPPAPGSQGMPAPDWLKALLITGLVGCVVFVGKTGYDSVRGVQQADVKGAKEEEQKKVEKLKDDTGKRVKKGAHKAADAVKGTFEGDKTDYVMRALLGTMGVVAALAFAGITWPNKNRGSGGGKKPSYTSKELSPAGAAEVDSDDKKRMAKGPVPQTTGPGQATVRVDSSGQTTVATK